MSNYQPIIKKLWTLGGSGVGTTLAANGDSTNAGALPAIDVSNACDLALTVKTAAPGGTAPTLLVQVDMQDEDGNWILAAFKTASITAAGVAAVYAGIHMAGNPIVPLRYARVAWTVGGTAGPSWANTTINLLGR